MSKSIMKLQPLKGLRVLDFSNYLPGPLTTLMLAEAGAEILKIEPPSGDPMRQLKVGTDDGDSLFNMLNRGKRSLCVDLKSKSGKAFIQNQITHTDILVEQYRPGVMERLGFDYSTVKKVRDDIIYCSISGYGQSGSKARKAGHDLNYQTEAGLVSLVTKDELQPVLPSALFADIAGGSYPALLNILLAVLHRDRTGEGACLDIAMAENLSAFLFWTFPGLKNDVLPKAGDELFTGGSPRYQFYQAADNQWLALAPLEEPFWQRFCDLIELEDEFRGAAVESRVCIARVSYLIAKQTASHWMELFAGEDVCCSLVEFPSAEQRNLNCMDAIDTVVSANYKESLSPAPKLGEANSEFGL